MKPVVRLDGDDAAVREVGREAVEVLRAQPQAAAPLFARLWTLHQQRRTSVSRASVRPVSSAKVAPKVAGGVAYRAVWGVVSGIGLVAALVGAVMLGPADRKNAFSDPATSLSLALAAGTVAAAVLLVVLLLRVPDPASARTGEASSVVVGLLCAGVLVFRLVAGTSDDRGFTPSDLAVWLPLTAVVVLLIVGIVIRTDPVRRQAVAPSRRGRAPSGTDAVRQLRRDAEWAASVMKPDPSMMALWLSRLDAAAERGVDPAAVAQARTLTPAAWLAWLAYDGERDIAGVVPRS